jgi:hypothetical protein
MKMKKYEYKIFSTLAIPSEHEDPESYLNVLGREGWQIVASSAPFTLFMMREVNNEATQEEVPAPVQDEKQTEREDPKRHKGSGPAPFNQMGKDRNPRA